MGISFVNAVPAKMPQTTKRQDVLTASRLPRSKNEVTDVTFTQTVDESGEGLKFAKFKNDLQNV